jgi:hypothetical protein
MSDRALEFLDRWEADHVVVTPPNKWGHEAARLAEMCREDAVRAGVSFADLQRAAKGNLVQNMLEALAAAANRAKDEAAH